MNYEVISPFKYTTPEAMRAKDILDLFVPVFTVYYNVPTVGHTFINGPRGCGKSMMFRYMEPDCQSLVQNKKISELDYFAIHIPIKEGQLDKTDLSLLNSKHGEALLNEHFMVVNFAIKIFEKLGQMNFDNSAKNISALTKFYNEFFLKRSVYARWEKSAPLPSGIDNCKSIFNHMKEACSEINRDFTHNFLFKLVGITGPLPYNGPICLFSDFLLEILKGLKELPFIPKGPIYLLVDDADNLTKMQTRVLNTWVSMRTTKTLSFKISTQLNYKTYRTLTDSRIDTPHDYSEVNISDIYTAKKSLYRIRVKEAIERRLNKFGYKDVTADDFFPVDKEQEEKIKVIFADYQKKSDGKKGYDYAYRYARPDFMKTLKGNLNTFSYAGFDSLVHISSGIMRNFIDFANQMYTHQMAIPDKKMLKYIEPGIQDFEIKKYSDWFFDENFSKLREDAETDEAINDFDKLRNLIEALGQTFHLILFSDATERRVFSFALQNEPDSELRKILDLGVQNGYFQKSLIGNKMGTGKARLYILNRLLAPHFKLDPTSFAGYKFVTCEVLKEALFKPATIIGRIKNNGVDSVFDDPQHLLFKDDE